MNRDFVPNESELLMKALMDTVDAFYRAKGTEDDGRVVLDMRQILTALGSFAGRVIKHSPDSFRERTVHEFMSDFATHAGFKADIKLTPHT